MDGGRLIVSQQLNGWWETDSVTQQLNGWWETDSVHSS